MPPVSGPPTVRLPVGSIKVTVPLKASAFGAPDYPLDGPAPTVRLAVALENGERLLAEIGGKSFRRALKAMAAHAEAGADPTVILQGNLAPDGKLAEAGLTVPPVRAPEASA